MACTVDDTGGIGISGPLTLRHLGSVNREIQAILRRARTDTVAIRLEEITALDTAGVIFLEQLSNMTCAHHQRLDLGPVPERFRAFQAFVRRRDIQAAAPPQPRISFAEHLGEWVLRLNHKLAGLLFLGSDLSWSALRGVFTRSGVRPGTMVEQAVALGSSALPIVALILFLIGAVSSLQAAAQLRKFGADIFVAELLAIGVTRELGPLMTAIIVAGRSGSSIAAEVATMKYGEELDALRTMSLDPLRFVAVPKLWAMLLCIPMLTIIADFVGILGGISVGVTVMGIAPQAFLNQVLDSLFLRDVITGLVKSFSFAWAITVIGVFEGLEFTGGAAGVGRATTASVVKSITAIIVLDCFWGLVFYLG